MSDARRAPGRYRSLNILRRISFGRVLRGTLDKRWAERGKQTESGGQVRSRLTVRGTLLPSRVHLKLVRNLDWEIRQSGADVVFRLTV